MKTLQHYGDDLKRKLVKHLKFSNQNKMKIEGDIKLNGQIVDWNTISKCSGYVQQDDLFVGTMTVREHLSFLVQLPQPSVVIV